MFDLIHMFAHEKSKWRKGRCDPSHGEVMKKEIEKTDRMKDQCYRFKVALGEFEDA